MDAQPIISDETRAANVDQGRAANQSNATTGVYGISGSGKSNLADTAAEFCYEQFNKITLVYAADLGGFGNKRLALIHAGIVRVYDPRNHVNPFETMELISLGAWPETVIDPERGFAAPDVKLILPRRVVYLINCPQGHEVTRLDDQIQINALSATCPTCGLQTAAGNAKIEQVVVRHRMFKDVGLRVYDSMTALNEWGLQDLQEQSAKGTLPTTGSGGSLLGAADALRSGQFAFGSSSMGQYGFLQNRSYGWLSNIRKIPDQIVPAIATFHVEQSKGDESSGGDMLYGPKIAGNARTAALPGWLGNCLHATKEPFDPKEPGSPLVFRLWLTNHIDPRDPRKIPYVAKHRGTPLDMPEYLEDAPGSEAWSGFSLKVFFAKLQAQLAKLDAQAKVRYPNAPGMWSGEDAGAAEAMDEVVGTVAATAAAASAVRLTGGAGRRLRGVPPAVAAATTPIPVPISQIPAAPVAAQPTPVASLNVPAGQGQSGVGTAVSPSTPVAPPISQPAPPPTPAAAVVPGGSRLRRAARPPV